MTEASKTTELDNVLTNVEMRRRPQQQRAYKRVELILDIAEKLIAETGVSEVNTRLIAKEAQLPVGTIYQFFKNMRSIEEALVERTLKEVDKDIVTIFEGSNFEGKWENAVDDSIDALLDAFRKNPNTIPLIRKIYHTETYQKANQQSNERLAKNFADFYQNAGLNLNQTTLKVIGRIIVEISDSIQLLIWCSETKDEQDIYINEWKTLTKIYIGHHING